jgi:predicted DNA binding CopG/RHH family protein
VTSKKKKKLADMSPSQILAAADELEREARDRGQWTETPQSRARGEERTEWREASTELVSIRFPKGMLKVLRAMAASQGIGYQTFIKQLLHQEILRRAKERRADARELADILEEDQDRDQVAVAALTQARSR